MLIMPFVVLINIFQLTPTPALSADPSCPLEGRRSSVETTPILALTTITAITVPNGRQHVVVNNVSDSFLFCFRIYFNFYFLCGIFMPFSFSQI